MGRSMSDREHDPPTPRELDFRAYTMSLKATERE